MRRSSRINREWETPENDYLWEHVAIEVLMDIRAELRTLNKTLSCYRVIEMADACRRIDRRLAHHGLRLRKKKAR